MTLDIWVLGATACGSPKGVRLEVRPGLPNGASAERHVDRVRLLWIGERKETQRWIPASRFFPRRSSRTVCPLVREQWFSRDARVS
jgi:hypothetical protein